jgi:hypothetical protein
MLSLTRVEREGRHEIHDIRGRSPGHFCGPVMAGSGSLAAGPFEGVWKVEDSSGKPMQITLSGGGKATGSVHGMSGTWKEEGKGVVITWDTGWTTKIEQQDGHYKHLAYRKGQSSSGPANNSSDAQKVK